MDDGYLRLMPHHFLDMLRAWAPEWRTPPDSRLGHRFPAVVQQLLTDSGTHIEIAIGVDDVCTGCAARTTGYCAEPVDTTIRKAAPDNLQEYNELIDARLLKALGLSVGDRLTATELCARFALLDDYSAIYSETPKKMMKEWNKRIKAGIVRYLDFSRTTR